MGRIIMAIETQNLNSRIMKIKKDIEYLVLRISYSNNSFLQEKLFKRLRQKELTLEHLKEGVDNFQSSVFQ